MLWIWKQKGRLDVPMDIKTKELLEEIKAYRNDMVARNYPYQQITNIITKWEMKQAKTVSEKSQEELEPIRDTSNDPFKGTSIEGKD